MTDKKTIEKLDRNGSEAIRFILGMAEETAISMRLDDRSEEYWTIVKDSLTDSISEGYTDFFTDEFTSSDELRNEIAEIAGIAV